MLGGACLTFPSIGFLLVKYFVVLYMKYTGKFAIKRLANSALTVMVFGMDKYNHKAARIFKS